MPFLAQHPELKVEILSGGLFIEEHSRPIGDYPHIPNANQRITATYGVPFGAPYQELLQRGTLVLDSYRPAVAQSVFKSLSPEEQHISIAKAIQHAFYVDGLSLSLLDTYLGIARAHGLDAELVGTKISEAWSRPEATMAEEFAQVRALGVESFPSLFLEHNGRYYSFGMSLTLEALEERFAELRSSL